MMAIMIHYSAKFCATKKKILSEEMFKIGEIEQSRDFFFLFFYTKNNQPTYNKDLKVLNNSNVLYVLSSKYISFISQISKGETYSMLISFDYRHLILVTHQIVSVFSCGQWGFPFEEWLYLFDGGPLLHQLYTGKQL